MKPFTGMAILAFFAIQSFVAPAFAKPQAGKTVKCTTTAEGLLSHTPVAGISLPMADQVFLEVDVPPNGTPVSLEMTSRARAGGSWITCQAGTPCGEAIFPAGLAIGNSGPGLGDGSRTYGGLVSANWHCNNGTCFYGDTFIRLAVTYTMQGETCIMQQQWQLAANQNFPMALVLPEAATFIGFKTFATEIPPAAPSWQQCDEWDGGNAGHLVKNNACISGPPGAIGFILYPIDQMGGAVPMGQERGFQNVCSNASGSLRRACKVQITYRGPG